MFETINYEVKDSIGILTINREKALNAINNQVLSDLDKVLDEIKADKVHQYITEILRKTINIETIRKIYTAIREFLKNIYLLNMNLRYLTK